MKKIILSLFFLAFLFGLQQNIVRRNNVVSVNLILTNIEALAANEGGDTYDCWETISEDGPNAKTHVTYCGSCNPILARGWSDNSTCN